MKNLKIVLIANALFSFVTGLMCLLFTSKLSNFLTVENSIILSILGIGLLIFAAFVLFVATQRTGSRLFVNGIILADFTWVLASITLIILRPVSFSLGALSLIAAIAFIVLTFGLLQHKFKV